MWALAWVIGLAGQPQPQFTGVLDAVMASFGQFPLLRRHSAVVCRRVVARCGVEPQEARRLSPAGPFGVNAVAVCVAGGAHVMAKIIVAAVFVALVGWDIWEGVGNLLGLPAYYQALGVAEVHTVVPAGSRGGVAARNIGCRSVVGVAAEFDCGVGLDLCPCPGHSGGTRGVVTVWGASLAGHSVAWLTHQSHRFML